MCSIFTWPAKAEIDGNVLGEELNRIMNDAGWKRLQEHYDKLQYTDAPIDGPSIAQNVATTLSRKFHEMELALKNLKRTTEDTYERFTIQNPYRTCCDKAKYTYNTRFRDKVSFDELCITTSAISSKNVKYPTNSVLAAMIQNNANNPSLLWQYVALETGVMINYPSLILTDCNKYDPRFRPYYKTAVSPIPKDLVLVIDASSSMTGDLLNKAKEAAITAIETLDYHDRVGVVMFNDKAEVPESNTQNCYRSTLASITRKTKKFLKGYINSRTAKGKTNYDVAMKTAFKYFQNSANNSKDREKIMLFLTEGENTGGNPLDIIRDENHKLQNGVIIHTFGVGIKLSTDAKALLANMSQQTLNNNSFGEIKKGRYQIITNLRYLPEAVGSFYTFTSNPKSTSPIFTSPYNDFYSNNGLIMSSCLPVKHMSTFQGVICADIKLSELVSDVTYLQEGDNSYAFIIDGNERTIVHPLLPDPRDNYSKEYDVDNIYHFEIAGDVKKIINSMKMGQSGNATIATTLIKSRGNLLEDGILQRQIQAEYSWEKIIGTNFSLCVVTEKGIKLHILKDQPSKKDDFIYHRWDLTERPPGACRHYGRFASKVHSMVKFTPEAFKNPYNYIDTEETSSEVKKFASFISGETDTNPGIRLSALNSIRATKFIEDVWKNNTDELAYIVWRFMGTEAGVIRSFPGIRLLKDYDHKLRPWYHQTITHKNKNVVSAPYTESWGSGKVISVSRAVFKGTSNVNGGHKENDPVEAVIGTSFSILYFHRLLQYKYKQCNDTEYSCIIIDDSGFLVMHPYFVQTYDFIIGDRPIHITTKEGRIAKRLMDENVMYRQPCLDVENQKHLFTYRVTLPNLQKGIDRMDTDGFELRPVPESNLFIILKKKKNDEEETCCNMQDSKISPNNIECTSDKCGCLCYSQAGFNDCENKYKDIHDHIPCSARLPLLTTAHQSETEIIKSLPSCFPFDCKCRKTERECYDIYGCSWCTETSSGDSLETAFCDYKDICPFQKCASQGNLNPTVAININYDCRSKCLDDITKEKHSSDFQIVLPVIFCFLVCVAAIAMVLLRRRMAQGENLNNTYIDPIYNENESRRNNQPIIKEMEDVGNQSSTDSTYYEQIKDVLSIDDTVSYNQIQDGH